MSPYLYLKANTVLAAEKVCWCLTGSVAMRILLLRPNYRCGETEITATPATNGFGSQRIEVTVTRQISGSLKTQWGEGGVSHSS